MGIYRKIISMETENLDNRSPLSLIGQRYTFELSIIFCKIYIECKKREKESKKKAVSTIKYNVITVLDRSSVKRKM